MSHKRQLTRIRVNRGTLAYAAGILRPAHLDGELELARVFAKLGVVSESAILQMLATARPVVRGFNESLMRDMVSYAVARVREEGLQPGLPSTDYAAREYAWTWLQAQVSRSE